MSNRVTSQQTQPVACNVDTLTCVGCGYSETTPLYTVGTPAPVNATSKLLEIIVLPLAFANANVAPTDPPLVCQKCWAAKKIAAPSAPFNGGIVPTAPTTAATNTL